MIEVIVIQSSAAKNSWSWSIEKYKANPAPTKTGREHTTRLMIERSENGNNLLSDINLIENCYLSSNRLCTIL